MKSILLLASLLIIPVVYTANAKAADQGCNESCQGAYTEMMAQEKALSEGKTYTKG